MAVLLDPPRWPAHGTMWSHLVSDSSLAELHALAHAAGIPARGFDQDHYDVPAARHEELLALGACAVTGRELIGRLRASGLRRSPVARARERAALLTRWEEAVGGADHDDDARRAAGPAANFSRDAALRAAGPALLAAWSQRGRLHHGVRHLVEVLTAIDLLAAAAKASAREVRVARLAAWFHDAVHASGLGPDERTPEPGLSDEAASARLAERMLAGDPDAGRVVVVVLMTQTHAPEGDVAGAILCDADLAVLGSAPARYADYAAAIRQEYARVPDAAFRAGRAAILQSLLEGPLFHTAAGRSRWEAQARANVTREIAELT